MKIGRQLTASGAHSLSRALGKPLRFRPLHERIIADRVLYSTSIYRNESFVVVNVALLSIRPCILLAYRCVAERFVGKRGALAHRPNDLSNLGRRLRGAYLPHRLSRDISLNFVAYCWSGER
jgi:hypothetical protein